MRKITKEASQAFKDEMQRDNRENYLPLPNGQEEIVYSNNNTQVIIYWTEANYEGKDKHTILKLHGNTIVHHVQNVFCFEHNPHKQFDINLCGWATNTTRERLNGLLETLGFDFRIKQLKGEQIAHGKKYGSSIKRSYTLDEDTNQNVFLINSIITGKNISQLTS